MNIQSSLNSAFSVATFLYSQSPAAEEVRRKRTLELEHKSDVARKQKAADIARTQVDVAQGYGRLTEAEEKVYQEALATETAATGALFATDPTPETHAAYVGSREAQDIYQDTVDLEAQEQADIERRAKEAEATERERAEAKAKKEREAAARAEQERLQSDAIRRRILSGGNE